MGRLKGESRLLWLQLLLLGTWVVFSNLLQETKFVLLELILHWSCGNLVRVG